MKIIGNGFLSKAGLLESQSIEGELREILNILQDLVELGDFILQSANLEEQETEIEKRKVVCSVLMARILEISEAIIVLAKGGFSNEVMSSVRNFVEVYFIFGNACIEKGFFEEYFKTDLVARKKIINVALQSKSEIFEKVRNYATDDVVDELKNEILDLSAVESNCYHYAKKIGCTDIYDGLYRIASSATHSTPRSLEVYVSENENEDVVEIKRKPQINNIDENLYSISYFLTNVCDIFGSLVNVDVKSQLIGFEERIAIFESKNLPK